MSKRNAAGSRLARKRRKAGVSHAAIDLDASDEDKVENIRVWNVTKSETTGRVSGTRRNFQHVYKSSPEPLGEETSPVEDTGVPADPYPTKQPSPMPATKRKQVRVTKENDSVSFLPKLIRLC
jgi:hypothetical protein